MGQLQITTNLSINPWTDLAAARESGDLVHGVVDGMGMLPAGMTSGRASVALRGVTDDGKPFVVEIAWAMLQTAVHALAATPTVQMEDL